MPSPSDQPHPSMIQPKHNHLRLKRTVTSTATFLFSIKILSTFIPLGKIVPVVEAYLSSPSNRNPYHGITRRKNLSTLEPLCYKPQRRNQLQDPSYPCYPSVVLHKHRNCSFSSLFIMSLTRSKNTMFFSSSCDTSDSFLSSSHRVTHASDLFPFPTSLPMLEKIASTIVATLIFYIISFFPFASWSEDELSLKYGSKGFDSSLVNQSCLIDHCSAQMKTCLADDVDCRKGLICTAKCLGNNACITGCMARYGTDSLDNFLKCTIEDHSCIQVAILQGGTDRYEEAPLSPAPTLVHFDTNSLEGQWYKVMGYNPNYDCYPCQRNTFTVPDSENTVIYNTPSAGDSKSKKLEVDVEFSMPRMLPDGSPPPPTMERETIAVRGEDGILFGSQSIGLNDYQTHEVMIFDRDSTSTSNANFLRNVITLGKGGDQETSYRRTAHSEGEMFGLKFWENWYIIGENDPGKPEFKFVYYNGKTRQNTYEGAFVYSRTKELGPDALKKVYKIASNAGMNAHQFCKIQNGCFKDDNRRESPRNGLGSPSNPFRGILASTKVSQLLGVEPVAAEGVLKSTQTATDKLRMVNSNNDVSSGENLNQRSWIHELGDYLENPHRHFKTMDAFRVTMEWPEEVMNQP